MKYKWLTQNLDIIQHVVKEIHIPTNDIRAGAYGDGYGYPETGYYPDYSEYTNYVNVYYNHNDYSDYNNYCVINCELKCEVNQFVSHWINSTINEPNLEYIYAYQYNNIVDYLVKAKTYINNAVDANNLGESYKITFDLNKCTVSDVYYGINFNKLKDAIEKFINGATNIQNKLPNQDYILKVDMENLISIANNLQIPPTIPKNYEA